MERVGAGARVAGAARAHVERAGASARVAGAGSRVARRGRPRSRRYLIAFPEAETTKKSLTFSPLVCPARESLSNVYSGWPA